MTLRETIARAIELAIVRHGVPEASLEGTLDDAATILFLPEIAKITEALEAARPFVDPHHFPGTASVVREQIDEALSLLKESDHVQ